MTRARAWSLWLPPALYTVLIFVLSHMSRPPIPRGVNADALHYPEYFVMAWLLARAVRGTKPGLSLIAVGVLSAVLASLVGVTDEVHQAFVPERLPDMMDWLHDSVGAAVGALAWGGWTWWSRSRSA